MGLTDTEILDMSGVRIVAGADGRILDLSEHQEPDPITGWDDLPTVGDGGARFRLGDEAEIALAMQEHCLSTRLDSFGNTRSPAAGGTD